MQLNNFLYPLVFISFLFINQSATASHIVGGEISYTFLRFNSDESRVDYEVTLKLYRDPVGIPYEQFTSFGIFQQETWGAWKSYEVVRDVPLGAVREIGRDQDPCKLRSLNEERLEEATYTFEVTLEVGNNNYLISYQKGFRNYTITNIEGGGDIGSVYDILITPEALRNGSSSPTFVGIPPIFICSGFDLEIDNSAIDADGDEIIYSFCTPSIPGPEKNGPGCCGCQSPDPEICLPPYNDVVYVPPYTAQNPMGNSTLKVNSTSGLITGTPELTGSYVVAVCIEEYRNGVLLTKTKRDFEFNVVQCTENLIAKVQSDTYLANPIIHQDSVAYFESCNELDFQFINESVDENFIQDYAWQFYDGTGLLVSERTGLDNRDLILSFPAAGVYDGYMILNDGGTCLDTAFLLVNIIPEIDPLISINFDSCVAGPISFEVSSDYDLSAITWQWMLGDDGVESNQAFQYEYELRGSYPVSLAVSDEYGCTDEASFTLDWFPYELVPPDTLVRDTLLCHMDSIFIYDSWIFQAGTYLNYIASEFTGCDSIVERITVDFDSSIPVVNSEETICQGSSYFYNNGWISEAGLYYDTLSSMQGCDSVVSLSLDFFPQNYSVTERGLCASESFQFGDVIITSAGTYIDTLPDLNSCDSISELRVSIIAEKETYLEDGFCENRPYLYEGVLISSPGEYEYNYTSVWGCDSIVYLNLESYQTYNFDVEAEICENGSYTFGNEELTEGGDYIKIFSSIDGCDSIVVLDLIVREESNYEFKDTICLGETYAFGEIDLRIPGIYYDTLTNKNSCDSLVILDLVVGQNLTRINVDDELELDFGESILLEPNSTGEDLVSNEWSEVDEILAYTLQLDYVVSDDEWVYFESTNRLFCVALDSVFIRSILDIDIYFPNVISPDGDGFNDVFNIGASPTLAKSQLNIYDRWGNLIYEGPVTEDRNIEQGWDGTYRNQAVPIGTYTYVVRAEFINGEEKVYGGEVTVIR